MRSAFPNKGRRQKHSEAKEKFIKNRLGEIRPELASINIDQLENLLFEGQSESGNYLPMYEHDVYLDAHITGTNNEGKRIFGEDYITPHLEALKNPVPVRFLKILPGVRFQFNFILHDSNLAGMAISVADKEQLYRGILQQFGVGAKTNVGYGQFTTP